MKFGGANRSCLSAASALLLILAARIGAEPWPQWRGPRADGTSAEVNVPVAWSPDENIAWKIPLKGVAASTPIVWGDRLFITVQTGQGPIQSSPSGSQGPGEQQVASDPDRYGLRFWTQCFETTSGRLLWERESPSKSILSMHQKHNMSSPSCVTDGERVYSWFATGVITCFTMEGEIVWRRDLAQEFGPFVIRWGHGSSPVLHENSLILLCDHTSDPYLLAVDKKTGRDLWRSTEGLSNRSYSTPYIADTGEREEMLVNLQNKISSYNPATGEFYWSAEGLERIMVAMPVLRDGVVYTSGGYRNAPSMAIRPGGRSDVTQTHVVWRNGNGAPYTPSIVVVGENIFMADYGVARCLDTKTGMEIWKERVGNGMYSASPVVAEGRVYVTSEEGETAVFEASRKFNLLAVNPLEERTLASPAISGGRIYLRTDLHLWCIGAD